MTTNENRIAVYRPKLIARLVVWFPSKPVLFTQVQQLKTELH